jgi:hypothetical protein
MISNYENINIDKLEYLTPTKNSKGNYISNIKINNKDLILKTPKMKLINGIKSSNDRFLLDLQFEREHGKFYSFINKLDQNNVLKISVNCKQWFDQEFPLDVIDDFYKSPITPGDSKNPPKFKLKISDNNINVYSKNLQVNFRDVPNECYANLDIKILGLKFFKQQVALEWEVIQVNVHDDEYFTTQIKGKILNNNYSDDEYELTSNDKPKKVKLKKIKMNSKRAVEVSNFEDKLKDIDKLISQEFKNNKKIVPKLEIKKENEIDKYKRINSEKDKEITNLKKQLGLL